MGNDILEIRCYVADLLTATRRIVPDLTAPHPGLNAEAAWVQNGIVASVRQHVADLEEHLHRLGGNPDDARTLRALSARRAMTLRDDYSAISMALAGALMLETNARALGYSSTAALASRHREELAMMLSRLENVMPGETQERASA